MLRSPSLKPPVTSPQPFIGPRPCFLCVTNSYNFLNLAIIVYFESVHGAADGLNHTHRYIKCILINKRKQTNIHWGGQSQSQSPSTFQANQIWIPNQTHEKLLLLYLQPKRFHDTIRKRKLLKKTILDLFCLVCYSSCNSLFGLVQ